MLSARNEVLFSNDVHRDLHVGMGELGQFEVGDWAVSGGHFTLGEFLEPEPVGVDGVGQQGVGLSEAVVEVLGVFEFVLDGGEIPLCGVCQVII